MVSIEMTQLNAFWHVLLAMVLGGAIGWEREAADKPAGLRTHMLIAGAAALLVALGDVLIDHFGASQGSDLIWSDPIRIIQAIIAGVSFLGAGTIIRRAGGTKVEGLTTAASLLFAAAIGVAVALSQLLLAVGATALVLLTLIVLGRIEEATGKAEE
jgi:putative Mg2+ transporter-C (MgtC) family protein